MMSSFPSSYARGSGGVNLLPLYYSIPRTSKTVSVIQSANLITTNRSGAVWDFFVTFWNPPRLPPPPRSRPPSLWDKSVVKERVACEKMNPSRVCVCVCIPLCASYPLHDGHTQIAKRFPNFILQEYCINLRVRMFTRVRVCVCEAMCAPMSQSPWESFTYVLNTVCQSLESILLIVTEGGEEEYNSLKLLYMMYLML